MSPVSVTSLWNCYINGVVYNIICSIFFIAVDLRIIGKNKKLEIGFTAVQCCHILVSNILFL